MLTRKNALLMAGKTGLDLVVLGAAYYLALLIRQVEGLDANDLRGLLLAGPCYFALKFICLMAFGVPTLTWRYFSFVEAKRLLIALLVPVTIVVFFSLTARSLDRHVAAWATLPLGVLPSDFFLSVLGMVAMRASARSWAEHTRCRDGRLALKANVPTLFIGAGYAGAFVARQILSLGDLGIEPVGFIDDDPDKVGSRICGLTVLGTTEELARVVEETGAKQALITIGNLSGPNTRRIAYLCARCKLVAKIIPGIRDIVAGQTNLATIRDVAIEDLLHREPVSLDNQAIGAMVRGQTIMVSGAGGSIGSELCRELCRYSPAVLLLVEQAENGLFHIHRRLSKEFAEVSLVPCVADICDRTRLEQLFARWRPSMVFHAAAHKHVPLMEWNPGEAIKNNVFGTKNLADLAQAFGVRQFVMLSTDKAVNPSSIMGVSKRISEMYTQALAAHGRTRFVSVRFGNVLGSAGSVIPIFKEQIAKGGPITITHPDMERFFMTIPEACQLVLQAASMGDGGEIFILDMGQPVKIIDLANDLIRLSGLRPDEIDIVFTGTRPGEKLSEELTLQRESLANTRHSKIFVCRGKPQDCQELTAQLGKLRLLVDNPDAEAIIAALKKLVPEYRGPQGEVATALPVWPRPVPESEAVEGIDRALKPLPVGTALAVKTALGTTH
jgi:FlaA1/EpsC-like NDP-sugar epimerase